MNLTDVTICGNIFSLARNTFGYQPRLQNLYIRSTKLSYLPNRLFNNSYSIKLLNLAFNQFKELPVNIFQNILNIQHLDFSYNVIVGCSNSTIGPEFRNLSKLKTLELTSYGRNQTLCSSVGKDYLQPLEHVSDLYLSNSQIFYGDPRILSPLKNLEQLVITGVPRYKECPSEAEELFKNLPAALRHIILKNWASTDVANKSCFMTHQTLSGLKKLPNLASIDASYSDKLFGSVLEPSVLNGFEHVTAFYLSGCGISSIESGSFNGLSKVSLISLDGNLLGPRTLHLYTDSQKSQLEILNLDSNGLDIATYHASYLLKDFVHLQKLFLENNRLENVPDFGYSENFTSNLIRLSLDNNLIESISDSDGMGLSKVLPYLEILSLQNNQIYDLGGLRFCSSIHELHLANNLLGTHHSANFKALQSLNILQYLDLSSNQIKSLTADLFASLPSLRTLNLANNELSILPDKVFVSTPELRIIDLSVNTITSLSASMIGNGLKKLFQLNLVHNQISELSPDLLYQFTLRKNISRIFLDNNPLRCSCSGYLTKWIRNASIISRPEHLTCSTPDQPSVNTNLLDYKPNYFFCKVKIPLMISGIVVSGITIALIFALPCYKYRWYVTRPRIVARAIAEKLSEVKFDQKCQYDAFISYDASSDQDTLWVKDKLIPAIEENIPESLLSEKVSEANE